LFAGLAARDPGNIGLARGVRALLAGPALFALGLEVFHNDTVAIMAIFAAVSALVFADFGGTVRERLIAYSVLACVGGALMAFGTAVAGSPVVSVLVAFVAVFAVRFAGNVGPRFAAAVSPAVLGLMLGLLVPAPVAQIPDRLLGWIIASAVAAVLAVTVMAHRPSVRVVDVAADAAGRLADSLRVALTSADSDARAEALNMVVRARAAIRSVALVPSRPSGPGARDVARRQILDRLIRVAGVLETTLKVSEPVELSREMRDFGLAAAALLDASAATLRDPAAGTQLDDALQALDGARERGFARLEQLAGDTVDGDVLVDRIDAGFAARASAVHGEAIATEVAALTGHVIAAAGGGSTPPPARASTELRTRVGRFADAYVEPISVWFRDAFRAAFALSVAVAVAQALQLDHAFWVALGTLSVLRSTALATGQDAVRAAWGTGLGVAVSSLVLVAVGDQAGWLWVGVIVCSFLLAYLPIVAGFVWGQAAFTVFVVMLFNIVEPTGWHTGLIRIENVGLGVLVSTAVAFMFWPRRIEPLLQQLIARASTHAGALLVRVVRAAGNEEDVDASTNALAAEEARARAALVELMTQRRGHPAGATPWIERLAIASHTRSAANAVLRLRGLVDAAPIPEPLQGALESAASAVADGLAPGVGAPDPPIEPSVDADTRAAAVATITGGAGSRRGVVRGLLVRDWLLALATQCEQRP